MKIIGVIPARFKSTRFPGKPLADICGKPMVWWVYHRASQVKLFDRLYVATDDDRIKEVCKKFNIEVMMTSSQHPTGTDRVAEVARKIKADLYVNIQGDEPLMSPQNIEAAIKPFLENKKGMGVTNLMAKVTRLSDLLDTTVPKVVVNNNKEAIFLSRLPVPYPKDTRTDVIYYKQICVYGFLPWALEKFSVLPQGFCERVEQIELLRFIENHIVVKMVEVEEDTIAVDTPSDLERVRRIISEKN